jgi:hypothetical protein
MLGECCPGSPFFDLAIEGTGGGSRDGVSSVNIWISIGLIMRAEGSVLTFTKSGVDARWLVDADAVVGEEFECSRSAASINRRFFACFFGTSRLS